MKKNNVQTFVAFVFALILLSGCNPGDGEKTQEAYDSANGAQTCAYSLAEGAIVCK